MFGKKTIVIFAFFILFRRWVQVFLPSYTVNCHFTAVDRQVWYGSKDHGSNTQFSNHKKKQIDILRSTDSENQTNAIYQELALVFLEIWNTIYSGHIKQWILYQHRL